MPDRTYLRWLLGVISLGLIMIAGFNLAADSYILRHRNGASVQLMSGFERVLKPAWLESVQPSVVFVGSSRVRQGFDPVLVKQALGLTSFNYGVSTITAYETRRLIQDAAAQLSVRMLVVSLDSFTRGNAAQPFVPGFEETRLAVTADGRPTKNRTIWLNLARALSGGALSMHALSVSALLRLEPDQAAADRPDIFGSYSRMTNQTYRDEIGKRAHRSMQLSDWQRGQLRAALAAICARPIEVLLFFPPDNFAMTNIFMANDADGMIAFKRQIVDDVADSNTNCQSRIRLFDFMYLTAMSGDVPAARDSAYYVDLVHFRAPLGTQMLQWMLAPTKQTAGPWEGVELTGDRAAAAAAAAQIERLRSDVLRWRALPH